MTQKDPESDKIRLRHMIDAARECLTFAARTNRVGLESDRALALAMIKEIEMIGEAASQISDSFKRSHPKIPWEIIVGMRHRLIHGYFDIDLDIVWQTVTHDLAPLSKVLQALL